MEVNMQSISLKLAHVLSIMLRVAVFVSRNTAFQKRISTSSRPVTDRREYSGRIPNLRAVYLYRDK